MGTNGPQTNSLRNKRSRERVVQLTNGPSFDCSFRGTISPVTELQHETSSYVAGQYIACTKITDEKVSTVSSEVAVDKLK